MTNGIFHGRYHGYFLGHGILPTPFGNQWEFDRFLVEDHGDIMEVNGIGDPAFTMGVFDGIQASNND